MRDRSGHPTPIAALLLVLVAAACGPAAPTPGPTATGTPVTPPPTAAITAQPSTAPTPVETPADTGTAGTLPCDLADLKASHGLIEAGAGSIFTEVVLVSATTCSVDAFPALALRDANGTPLVNAAAAGTGAIDLVSGVAYSSDLRLGNWCVPDPAFPVGIVVITQLGELAVTGTSFPEDGDLPSCNGDGGPNLVATGWAPPP